MNAPVLKPCPHCRVMLTAALADAIADPKQHESCPSALQPVKDDGLELAQRRLIAYAMRGRVAERRSAVSS